MNFVKRAFLSLKNRKAKVFLHLVICTCICMSLVSGLAIQAAAEEATAYARESLGARVTLSMNKSTILEQLQELTEESSGESGELQRFRPVIEPLPVADARALANSSQVIAYNLMNSMIVSSVNFDAFSFYEDEQGEEQRGSASILEGNINLQGTSCSLHANDFYDGTSKIIEGRHILEADKDANVALINTVVAKRNHLQVGDSIVLGHGEEETKVEIIGIYETSVTSEILKLTPINSRLPYNKIYVPYTLINRMTGVTEDVVQMAEFFLADIDKTQEFMAQAESKSDLDFGTFQFSVDDVRYAQMTSVIKSVATISEDLIYFGTIGGFLALCALTWLRIRERKTETQLLMAMGEKKGKIFGQFMIEGFVVALIALGISIAMGDWIVSSVSERILSYAAQTNDFMLESYGGSLLVVGESGSLTQLKTGNARVITDLDVELTGETVANLGGLGLGVIMMSNAVPCLSILRQEPKASKKQK